MMATGCRLCISQQLRDYNPRQLGICNFNSNSYCGFNRCGRSKPLPCSWFGSKTSSRCKLASRTLYSSSSSSSVTNDSGDLAGVSYDYCVQGVSEVPAVNPSLSQNENGRAPPTEEVASVAGGIVALGKFDALHIGHRELAIQASKIGVPYLLSFVGMAEVLGWEQRPPVVAQCDRKRVLSSWAPLCGNIIPKEYHVEFSKVRHLTPQQFVQQLSEELGVRGVVAGQNYRFGYKAAGNSSDLVRLCEDYGMDACIIRSVMDKNRESTDKGSRSPQDQGQVSSTRVRYALSIGDMKYVSELLGRSHRLVLKGPFSLDGNRLSAPRSCLLNLPPTDGLYSNCSLIIGDESVLPCRFVIDTTDVHMELLDELAADVFITKNSELSIEFGESKSLI